MERCVDIPWENLELERDDSGILLKVTGKQAEYLNYVHEWVQFYFKNVNNCSRVDEIANYLNIPLDDVHFCLELMTMCGEIENITRNNAHNN